MSPIDMRIFVAGASGFIGGHVTAALLADGHQVVAGVRDTVNMRRRFPAVEAVAVEFNRDLNPADWLPRLRGIDAVINCVGILQDAPGQSSERIHFEAPKALFHASAQAGLQRVVHISAISADASAHTIYASTKFRAEECLRASTLEWVIIRPSLVYGDGTFGGTSLIRGLAGLPYVIPLVDGGPQPFQPIHVDDLARFVVRAVAREFPPRQTLTPGGPDRLTLKDLVLRWRAWLGFPEPHVIDLSPRIAEAVARVWERVDDGPISVTALRQLHHGNASDPGPFIAAAGFQPRRFEAALAARPASVQDRWHARLYFLRPLARLSLALLWLVSGAIEFASVVWLELEFAFGGFSRFVFVSHSLLEIAIGLLLMMRRRPRALGAIQLGVVAVDTLALTFWSPWLWLDPYGPLLKNAAVAGLVVFYLATDNDR